MNTVMKMENNDYIYTLEIAVRDYELDSEGIVNNAIYLHYLELTRHEFCRWAGYSFKEMSADGIVPVLNRVEIDYKTPLRSGDVMLSSLWVERKGVRFVFHQDIRNKYTGEMAVSAVVSVVSLEDGKLSCSEKLFHKFKFIHEKTPFQKGKASCVSLAALHILRADGFSERQRLWVRSR